MDKKSNFNIEERLSLDRLKHRRVPLKIDTAMKRDLPPEAAGETIPVKDLVANLLAPENDAGADFERAVTKRGAERFAEWVENELRK